MRRSCTPLYWITHPNEICVTSLKLGCKTYTRENACTIFNNRECGDMTFLLAAELAAAKLNILCCNNDHSCVDGAIAAADQFLCKYQLGCKMSSRSTAWCQFVKTFIIALLVQCRASSALLPVIKAKLLCR